MSGAKNSQIGILNNPSPADFVANIIDVSDTSMAPTGTNKIITLSALLAAFGLRFKNNMFASAAPTVTDDASVGYQVGCMWHFGGDFWICTDATEGAAVWEQINGAGGGDLQAAYDAGRVVNTQTFTIDENGNIGIGLDALDGATGTNKIALGRNAGKGSSESFQNFLGEFAGEDCAGRNVNAFGTAAGKKSTSDNSNYFGNLAGYDGLNAGNTTPFGVTVFSAASLPQYPNHSDAVAGLTVAAGCVAGNVYFYLNTSNNHVEFVIP